jgi:hypothetical protein
VAQDNSSLGSFCIADNLDEVWTLQHRDLQNLQEIYDQGLRLLKAGTLVVKNGSLFPVDVCIRKCIAFPRSTVLYGHVIDKGETFYYTGEVGWDQQECYSARLKFGREPC